MRGRVRAGARACGGPRTRGGAPMPGRVRAGARACGGVRVRGRVRAGARACGGAWSCGGASGIFLFRSLCFLQSKSVLVLKFKFGQKSRFLP